MTEPHIIYLQRKASRWIVWRSSQICIASMNGKYITAVAVKLMNSLHTIVAGRGSTSACWKHGMETISIVSKFSHFRSRKWVWKCRQEMVGHSVSGAMWKNVHVMTACHYRDYCPVNIIFESWSIHISTYMLLETMCFSFSENLKSKAWFQFIGDMKAELSPNQGDTINVMLSTKISLCDIKASF